MTMLTSSWFHANCPDLKHSKIEETPENTTQEIPGPVDNPIQENPIGAGTS